jgi:uncharacterized protein DUF4333
MPSPVARLAALLAAGSVAVALAACGSTENTVDQASLESSMVSLANQTADVDSASCPDDVSSDAGTEFECTVINAKGQEVPVTATITSEGDEDVQFEVQTIDGVDITK